MTIDIKGAKKWKSPLQYKMGKEFYWKLGRLKVRTTEPKRTVSDSSEPVTKWAFNQIEDGDKDCDEFVLNVRRGDLFTSETSGTEGNDATSVDIVESDT